MPVLLMMFRRPLGVMFFVVVVVVVNAVLHLHERIRIGESKATNKTACRQQQKAFHGFRQPSSWKDILFELWEKIDLLLRGGSSIICRPRSCGR